MPHPAKVSTNSFLDIMTVKYQSPLKNSQIPLMLTNSFVHIFLLLKWKKARHMHVSVADPKAVAIQDFPNSKGGCDYYLVNFSQKLHEMERIWTLKRASLVQP